MKPQCASFWVALRLACLCSLFPVFHASAQLEMQWRLEYNKTLLYEPVNAILTIVNRSGTPLDFTPRGNAVLEFDVEDQPSHRILSNGRPVLERPIIIPDGETREFNANLLNTYAIHRPQYYSITPRIALRGAVLLGEKKTLEVLTGVEVVKRDYGMPGDAEGRTAILRTLNRNRTAHLLFRLDNRRSACLGVLDLGTFLRLFTPRIEQDAEGYFHVLHQSGPQIFVHSVFAADATRLQTEYFQGEVSSMRLLRDVAGAVTVSGGAPFIAVQDRPGYFMAPGPPPATDFPTTLPQREKAPAKKSFWRRGD